MLPLISSGIGLAVLKVQRSLAIQIALVDSIETSHIVAHVVDVVLGVLGPH